MEERVFGKYRLVEEIATGGMAKIYLAKTSGFAGFEKFVALKMIHENFSNDNMFAQMLIEEAKLTVQLQHVNIAQTFDLGKIDGKYYFTMEFVKGADLYRIMRNASRAGKPVPSHIAAHVVREVCNGLDYAHNKLDRSGSPLDIIHRDVSPQNVLVSRSGEVKLVDFGIARASKRAQKTQVGVIKGKYYYMSPEQSRGDTLDRRTDIFAAGILLYEMLAGRMLYFHTDVMKLLELVRAANIPPMANERSDIPPELEAIVMKALAKRPRDRFSTAAEMSNEIADFLNQRTRNVSSQEIADWVCDLLDPEVLKEENIPGTAIPATATFDSNARAKRGEQIHDENSVIFNLDDLEDPTSPEGLASLIAPTRDTHQAPPRNSGQSTQIIEHETLRRTPQNPPVMSAKENPVRQMGDATLSIGTPVKSVLNQLSTEPGQTFSDTLEDFEVPQPSRALHREDIFDVSLETEGPTGSFPLDLSGGGKPLGTATTEPMKNAVPLAESETKSLESLESLVSQPAKSRKSWIIIAIIVAGLLAAGTILGLSASGNSEQPTEPEQGSTE